MSTDINEFVEELKSNKKKVIQKELIISKGFTHYILSALSSDDNKRKTETETRDSVMWEKMKFENRIKKNEVLIRKKCDLLFNSFLSMVSDLKALVVSQKKNFYGKLETVIKNWDIDYINRKKVLHDQIGVSARQSFDDR
jgi:hypothetical protein